MFYAAGIDVARFEVMSFMLFILAEQFTCVQFLLCDQGTNPDLLSIKQALYHLNYHNRDTNIRNELCVCVGR